MVTSPVVAQPSYTLDYLNPIPKEVWGSSSAKYGQVSESGQVEKTPEELSKEAGQRAPKSSKRGFFRAVDQAKESVEGLKKAVEQGKELWGKAKYQVSKFLVEYLQWKTGKLSKSKDQTGMVTVPEAFKLIDQAEAEGRITTEEAEDYREQVISESVTASQTARRESAKFQVPERVATAFASTLTPESVGTSAFIGFGGAIINKGSSVAISSGVPALVVSGVLLKGGLLALSGIQVFKSVQDFRGLEAPEQLGVALGSLPLIGVASASYKFTSGILDTIPNKQSKVASDFEAIKQVSKKDAIVTTEQKQTIINIPKTQRGVEGINYKVFDFELTQPSSSTLLVDQSVPTGIFKVGTYGGKTVEIFSDINTGMTVAKVFTGTSPNVRAYAFTASGKIFGFDVSTADWATPTLKGMFFEGKSSGGAESIVIAPVTSYSEQRIKITQPSMSYKGAGLTTGDKGAGFVSGDFAQTRFKEGELGITFKTKYFRSGGMEVFGGSSPPTLRIKQDVFTEYAVYPAGTTVTTEPVTVSGYSGGGIGSLPDFKTVRTSPRPPLLKLGESGTTSFTVTQPQVETSGVTVSIPKLETSSGTVSEVASINLPLSGGESKLSLGLGEVSVASAFKVDQGQASKMKTGVILVQEPKLDSKLESVVKTKTRSASALRSRATQSRLVSKMELKTQLKTETALKSALVLSTVQVPMTKVMVTPSVVTPTLFRLGVRSGVSPMPTNFGRVGLTRQRSPLLKRGYTPRMRGTRGGRPSGLLWTTRSPNIVLFKGSRGIPRQSRGLEQRFLRTAIKTPASYSFDPFQKRRKR